MIVRPMKGMKYRDWTPQFPCIVQPKYDGIRCLIVSGEPQSSSGKTLPNWELQDGVTKLWLNGLDGELVHESGDFATTSSIVRSADKSIEGLLYYVFDYWNTDAPCLDRIKAISMRSFPKNSPRIIAAPSEFIIDQTALDRAINKLIKLGYEGVIIRNPNAVYKHGTAGKTNWELVKYKPFLDMEGQVIGYEPLQRNHNMLRRDAFGRAERSSHMAYKQPDDLLGVLICQCKFKGKNCIVRLGSGFTEAQRRSLWEKREELPGRFVTFKYLEHNSKERPRHPIFLRFRDRWDMTE
jgi:DNA ligase-1